MEHKEEYINEVARRIAELGWIAYVNESDNPSFYKSWIIFSKDMNSPIGYVQKGFGGFTLSIKYKSSNGREFGTGAAYREDPFSLDDLKLPLLERVTDIRSYSWVWEGKETRPYTYPLSSIKDELDKSYVKYKVEN